MPIEKGINDLQTIRRVVGDLERDLLSLRHTRNPAPPLLRRIASQCGLLAERIRSRKEG